MIIKAPTLDIEFETSIYTYGLDKILELQKLHRETLTRTRSLHHYTPSFTVATSIVENGVFWATHSEYMTDKRELKYGAELVEERIEEFRNSHPGLSTPLKEFLEMAEERSNPYSNNVSQKIHTYFVCFSEEGNLEHQWKKYAADYTGCCVDFEIPECYIDPTSEESTQLQHKNIDLLKVIYDRTEQIRLVDEILYRMAEFIKEAIDKCGFFWSISSGMGPAISMVNVLRYYVMSFKDASYSPEREWRCVYGMSDMMPAALESCHRIQRNQVLPYVRLSVVSNDGPLRAKEIRKGKNFGLSSTSSPNVSMSFYSFPA